VLYAKQGKCMSEQNCPICKELVKVNPRYPNHVCSACLEGGVDVNGNTILVSEIDVRSNLEVQCSVKGIECKAQEARFGGTVVQVI
jgi:hypothetical protein